MTVEQDAAEYGAHVKHGGWRLGLLVARCVENNGRGSANVQPHISGKVSAAEFARQSGTTHTRVLRYLEGWERAAAARLVPHAAALAPDTDVALPDAEATPWERFYRNEAGRHVNDPDRRDALRAEAERQGTGPSKVMDVASNPKAMEAAILADGPTAAAAQRALRQRYDRGTELPEPRTADLPPELADTDAKAQRAHDVHRRAYAVDSALDALMLAAESGWDTDQRAAAAEALRHHRLRVESAIVRLVGIDDTELAAWLAEADR